MHPVLFRVFSFPIHSYGFMLALSFLFGIWFSGRRARKRGLDPGVVTDVGFYVILSAIVGARLYYVLLHFEEFRTDLTAIFNPFHGGTLGIGGLVMYGGFIGAIVAGYIYFRVKKLPFLLYADVVAPSIGFGVCLTRIGCFLNGCCYGAPTTSFLGVVFPSTSPAGAYELRLGSAALQQVGHTVAQAAIYPSQLLESAGGLVLAGLVLLVGRKKIFNGLEFYMMGVSYAVLRFLIDFTRYYADNERIGPLSHNQVVCIALFVFFAGLIVKNVLLKEDPAAQRAPAVTASLPPNPTTERGPGDGDATSAK